MIKLWQNEPWQHWIMLAIIIVLLISVIYQWIGGFKPNFVEIKHQNIIVKPKTIDEKLLQNPLFGRYVPKNENDNSLQQSLLNIQILGIMYNATNPTVILKINNEDKTYAVDDKILDGVVIKQINKESIIIIHQGNLERIKMPLDRLLFQPIPMPLVKD